MSAIIRLLLLCLALTVVSAFFSVDSVTGRLIDEHNRFRVMHGLNVVYKEFPYYPGRKEFNSNDSLVAEDFVNLKNWGFNSLRLYIAWEGFEPKRLQYNYTYL
jgi:endoglycosylceramidase